MTTNWIVLSALISASLAIAATDAGSSRVGAGVEKFTVSRDDSTYECFPSLCRCNNGRIVVIYRESDNHVARDYCRIIVRTSDDNGRTFSASNVLIEAKSTGKTLRKYNCPKIQQLKDGRLLAICDVFDIPPGEMDRDCWASHVILWTSDDNGSTWSAPRNTDVHGIMPDDVIELDNGDWLLATQFRNPNTHNLMQCVTRSKDGGVTWDKPVTIADVAGLNLCEASILKLTGNSLVCYMRENSGKNLPIYKSISTDGGQTWQGPYETIMSGGHRPVAHLTRDGKVMITYRYQPGGGHWAKNFFAYLETAESALEPDPMKQCGIVLPLDHDRSKNSDGGYSGWVETAPGQFLAVAYIVDDAPKAQIRGYRFNESDF